MKVFRVILATVIFVPVLLFFIDFADILPDSTSNLLRIQLAPAIFDGAVIVLTVYFLLTLLFGRIYCSIVCPAGILQDIFNRISCIGKKKKNGIMRFRAHKPSNLLRYIILSVTSILAVVGFAELCLLLDPYSNFWRIGANIFRPVAIWINNGLANVLTSMGNYSLYNVSFSISVWALATAILAFVVFAVMVYFRGRLFCNTICPVGALLSIVSRYSLFRIVIDRNTCNKCSSCERTCKAEAIDSREMDVDASRCVSCFNCISSCNKKAINYRFAPKMLSKSDKEGVSKSRRSFLAVGATIVGTAPLMALGQEKDTRSGGSVPVTPPGSLSVERFKDICTGCHLCVVQCPSHVLQPAGLKYGLGFMLKPYMSYKDSFCNFSCTVCSEICPTGAIKPLTVEEKKTTQIGIANFYIERCIVNTEENDCGACSEHCPTQAVHMVPYKGTLTIPHV
ncbi:MAG: 4Fe-4S binding protein, partial [Tannerella sp.]|nr:4Fe-4S binding protein [Tannerella sp.]